MHRSLRRISVILVIALAIVTACTPTTPSLTPTLSDTVRTVTIFYTNDEHGYLEPIQKGSDTLGGAANLLSALRQRGYDPDGPDDDNALLISGGDMWTGPAISTWFQGASAVQVFNRMGYASQHDC